METLFIGEKAQTHVFAVQTFAKKCKQPRFFFDYNTNPFYIPYFLSTKAQTTPLHMVAQNHN